MYLSHVYWFTPLHEVTGIPTESRCPCVYCLSLFTIGVDLAGILGGRTASAEGEDWYRVHGVGYGVSPFQPTRRVWGSEVSSSNRVRGGVQAKNGFCHILKATERSILYLYDKF